MRKRPKKGGGRVRPSEKQYERILQANLGVCCVCKRREVGVVLHHIDGDASRTVDENLAVLCVQDHDAHHRPQEYEPRHAELGEAMIANYKRAWESFVVEARAERPGIIASVNLFGTNEQVHSMALILQRESGNTEYSRFWHLLSGPPQAWIDEALEEVKWLGPNVPIALIDSLLPVEHCPACESGLLRTLNQNAMTRMTSADWDSQSLLALYVNPGQASLAFVISLGGETMETGSIHRCGTSLHVHLSAHEERVPLTRADVRPQVHALLRRVVAQWNPRLRFFGTGNPDRPQAMRAFRLPAIWERTQRRRSSVRR